MCEILTSMKENVYSYRGEAVESQWKYDKSKF